MKIALITTFEQSVPPAKYGGTERIVSTLAEELVHMGHNVTLYASGDSQTSATLYACAPRAIRSLPESNTPAIRQALNLDALAKALDHINKTPYDIVHNNAGWQVVLFEKLIPWPMVTTLHNTIDKANTQFPAEHPMYNAHPGSRLVSISDSQRKHSPNLNYVDTIYHGLNLERFEFNNQPKDYLVFLGRIHPTKGPEEAIQIAKKTGQKLVIAARIDPPETEYFETIIKPHIDGEQISFVGEIDELQKIALLKDATALLSPLMWDEPFGIVNIEAMACGTPVIAINRGSIPEIIDDGKTGFLCDNFEHMAARIADIPTLSRKACRTAVEERFTARHMTQSYIDMYKRLLK